MCGALVCSYVVCVPIALLTALTWRRRETTRGGFSSSAAPAPGRTGQCPQPGAVKQCTCMSCDFLATPTQVLTTPTSNSCRESCCEDFSIMVFMRSRISHLVEGRRMFGGVTIPPVLGGGVTPTWGQRSEQRTNSKRQWWREKCGLYISSL